ncbi:MAG: chemotaxis protein CheA [Hormoscilla sp.]
MCNDSESSEIFTEFLEDYYAECEEHLAVVRSQLMALEADVNQPQIAIESLNELFRSFHSIKGLSGMVGVKEAEELAHQMESYLRSLRDGQVLLSPEGFDALMNGTKLLEEVLACHRSGTSLPDITAAVSKLTAVITDPEPTEQESPTPPTILDPPEQPAEQPRTWHFVFTPSAELKSRGVHVNSIRDRLKSIGDLINATPRMMADSAIVFDLIVASTAPETAFASWAEDGLTWEPDEVSETPQSEVTPQETETESHLAVSEVELQESERGEASSFTQTTTAKKSSQPTLINQPSNVVRVELPKLDELMRMVGDLVISRARLTDNLSRLKGTLPEPQMRALQEINLAMERQLRDLRQGVMRVRLVPIGEIFSRMHFVVRDIARSSQKQVTLEISGEETEIDKFVVERMMDPLLHLVRNAVSHGIESPSERIEAGKPPDGKIALNARSAGETIAISIADDGRGVDTAKVLQKGGLSSSPNQDEEANIPSSIILDILCSPGFSTKEQADLTSGRGVGMAIVKKAVQELGGLLTLETTAGMGTQFIIQLPLTLAIADALIVSVGSQTFAIPQSSIREVIELSASAITVFANNEIILYRGTVLPLLHLARLFKIPDRTTDNKSVKVVVVGNELNGVGLVVDRPLGLREIVVRPLTDPLVQAVGISGATELGDGRVVLILDVLDLIRTASQLKYGNGEWLMANG